MRIIFLSQVLPYPLDAGPKMRSYFTLRHLVQSHEVTLVTFIRDTDRPQDIDHLAKICHAIHTVPMNRKTIRDLRFLAQSIVSRQPFLIVRDQVAAMNKLIDQLVQSTPFDAVHVDQLWMAQYALAAKRKSPNLKLILDQHNAVHMIPKRMADDETNLIKRQILAREAQLLKGYEADICKQFDQVVWVTEEDRQAVAQLSNGKINSQPPDMVIPICADPSQTDLVTSAANRRRITFLGGLHWPPNAQGVVWFAKHVFPQIRAKRPNVTLTVIGKSPPAGLDGDGVEVTGYVPELKPLLAETAVFIVPLHAGGGMRVKILDAWSWGLPIVSTTIGAEGIITQHGQNILIADTADAFAQEILRVLDNPELAQKLARNGHQTVMEKYNWRRVYAAWDTVYQTVSHRNGTVPQKVAR